MPHPPAEISPAPNGSAAAAGSAALRVLPWLFAASGCAALIYQVTWFQLLTLHVGASAISLGVLLATFLGGLCLGSLLLPRYVPAARHPLKVYAVLELAIGALGLAVLYAIPLIGSVYAAWTAPGAASVALRAIVAALCLLPPAVLIGATLPAVARWVAAAPAGAARLGFLYAANTAGAVLGAIAAGFWLLRHYDVQAATLAAVALNIAVGFTSLVFARGVHVTGAAPAMGPPPGTASWPIYVATALSGFTALTAEVLWTRHLSLLFGSTVYTFALILAVFLFGLGVGSGAGAALGRRMNPQAAFAGCQLLVCVAMAWAAYVIARVLPYLPIDVTLPTNAEIALQLDLLRAAWAMLPAALLWGASFPLAIAATAGPHWDARRTVGRLYAANTAGAIAGTLITTFVLVTAIGTQATLKLAIVAAGCAAAVLAATLNIRVQRARARLAAGAALLAVLLLAATVPAIPPALVAYGRFLPTRGVDANVVYVGEGLTASIAVTREPDGTLTYHNAGKTQASSYPQDVRLQRMLGHLTTLAADAPKSVLVVGLGAGITAGAVSLDPAVERVVVAEIEPLVPVAAREYFAEHNFGVVTSPKVTLAIDDGRHYLATTDEKFDAITSDPLDPWVKGAAALYTREFWELCKARLNDGGVVTAFLQLYESTDAAVRSEIATFFDVFPNGAVFANTVNGQGYDAVLLARADGGPIDAARMQRRYGSRDYAPVARSLREIGFDSALELLATYAGQQQDLGLWLAAAPLNTDQNLRLQYLAGEGLNVLRAEEIFAAMMRHPPRFPEQLLTGSPAQLEALRQLFRGRHDAY